MCFRLMATGGSVTDSRYPIYVFRLSFTWCFLKNRNDRLDVASRPSLTKGRKEFTFFEGEMAFSSKGYYLSC